MPSTMDFMLPDPKSSIAVVVAEFDDVRLLLFRGDVRVRGQQGRDGCGDGVECGHIRIKLCSRGRALLSADRLTRHRSCIVDSVE